MTLLEASFEHGVLTLTLSDEQRRNALSRQLLSELVDAIDAAENDQRVRVIVLTNRGSVFCAGANLVERASGSTPTEPGRTIELSDLFLRIQRSPLPFVGRINGHCVAGGVGLAAVMDISIALDTALFGFTEVRIGVAPSMISVVCLPKMRRADASEAFLRGNRFSAGEAVRMGLINKALSAENIDAELTNVLNDLLKGEPNALAAAKQLSTTVPSMSIEEAFRWTTTLSMGLFASDEAREGISAFLEKRPASWVQQLPDE
jgi:methylglutaconyl-CoA hydratase